MTRLSFVVTVMMMMALPVAAWADPANDDVKWSQLPDVTALSFDYSSERFLPLAGGAESVVADDFICNDPRPITDIHWWGSYWEAPLAMPSSNYWLDPSTAGGNIVMPPTVLGFTFTIYDHVPIAVDPSTTDMPYAHPGSVLYQTFVPMTAIASNLYAVIDRTDDGIIGNVGDEAVWQYNVDLRGNPFEQTPGTTYWLSIQAETIDSPIQWGWHTAESLTNNNAAQSGPANLWGTQYQRDWVLMVDKDMAFELTVTEIPEPLTAGLLGLGLVSLLVSKRRRKQAE